MPNGTTNAADMIESVERVKAFLRQRARWSDDYWSGFYQEIHQQLFQENKNPDIIANWYICCLFDAGILNVHDLRRSVDRLDDIVAHGPRAFFRERYFSAAPAPSPTPPPQVDIKVSYGRSLETFQLERDTLSLGKVEEAVRARFRIPIAALEFYIGDDSRPASESRLQNATTEDPASINIVNIQAEFSMVKSIETALRMCGRDTKLEQHIQVSDLVEKIDIGENNEELKHAVATIKKLQAALPMPSSTRSAYIDPILVAAALISKEVTVEVERKIEGPLANGPVDYLFKYRDICVCVTEGKYNNLNDGVCQNIAQLSAVRSSNNSPKRGHDEISQGAGDEEDPGFYFGIATTYSSWQFTELQNKKVRVSDMVNIGSTHMEADVCNVVGYIVGMLNKGKNLIATSN